MSQIVNPKGIATTAVPELVRRETPLMCSLEWDRPENTKWGCLALMQRLTTEGAEA